MVGFFFTVESSRSLEIYFIKCSKTSYKIEESILYHHKTTEMKILHLIFHIFALLLSWLFNSLDSLKTLLVL